MQLTTRVRPFHLLQNILPLKFNARILLYLHNKTNLSQTNQNQIPTTMEMEMVHIPDSSLPLPTYQQLQMVTRAWILKRRTVLQVKPRLMVAYQGRMATQKVRRIT